MLVGVPGNTLKLDKDGRFSNLYMHAQFSEANNLKTIELCAILCIQIFQTMSFPNSMSSQVSTQVAPDHQTYSAQINKLKSLEPIS